MSPWFHLVLLLKRSSTCTPPGTGGAWIFTCLLRCKHQQASKTWIFTCLLRCKHPQVSKAGIGSCARHVPCLSCFSRLARNLFVHQALVGNNHRGHCGARFRRWWRNCWDNARHYGAGQMLLVAAGKVQFGNMETLGGGLGRQEPLGEHQGLGHNVHQNFA